jgi:hypothetical protein
MSLPLCQIQIVTGIFLFLYTIPAFSNALQEIPPSLISNPYQFLPPDVLKKSVDGAVRAEVLISPTGQAERCSTLVPLSPYCDSITIAALQQCQFTPAISGGNAIPSAIEIELLFNSDSLAPLFVNTEPVLRGRILFRKNDHPLPGVFVTVQFSDSTEDRSLQVPFTKYCSAIGKIPGQHFENGLFTTVTDSNGFFNFRLLPQGYFTLRATDSKNEQIEIDTSYSGTQPVKLWLFAEDFGEINDQYEIEVTGKSTFSKVIDLQEQQMSSGMTHSVGELLKRQQSIRTSSQSKAKMIVRSASPYDNQYLIAGVPFYSPYHFGGYSYGEIDGLMINTLNNISVHTDDLAGRYPSVSGVMVTAEPGIDRTSTKKKTRPELAIDLGTNSIDFLGSVKPRTRTYQIGFTTPNRYMLNFLKEFNILSRDAQLGQGFPGTFSNLTFTAQSSGKAFKESFFSWLAYDVYRPYDDFSMKAHVRPWGMASYTINSTANHNWELSFGGSHQYFADGKRIGDNAFLTLATISNGVLTFTADEIPVGNATLDLEFRGEGRQWRGSVKQRDPDGDPFSLATTSEEAFLSLHGGLTKKYGDLIFKANLLASSTIFETDPIFTIDPGILFAYQPDGWDIGISAGKITSYPDFRGVPDKTFRQTRLSSVVVSLPFHLNVLENLKLGLQPFARWQDKCAQMDPQKFIWDTTRTTALLAEGTEAVCELQPVSWITLTTNLILSNADRIKHGKEYAYEWESPYTVSCNAHLTLLQERLHTYLNWQKRSGTRYWDFGSNQYKRLMAFDDYSISFQVRNKVHNERFFTRYDCYATVENFLNFPSIRNYYWDKENVKTPIISDRFFLNFGVKAAFRL